MNFVNIINYIKINKNIILSFIGLITLAAITIWLILEFLGFLSDLPGFNFDPFMILLLSIFGLSTIRTNNKLIEVVGNQNKIINRIFKDSRQRPKKAKLKKNS